MEGAEKALPTWGSSERGQIRDLLKEDRVILLQHIQGRYEESNLPLGIRFQCESDSGIALSRLGMRNAAIRFHDSGIPGLRGRGV